jgi:hypothetical protein
MSVDRSSFGRSLRRRGESLPEGPTPPPFWRRVLRWCRDNPKTTGFIVGALLLGIAAFVFAGPLAIPLFVGLIKAGLALMAITAASPLVVAAAGAAVGAVGGAILGTVSGAIVERAIALEPAIRRVGPEGDVDYAQATSSPQEEQPETSPQHEATLEQASKVEREPGMRHFTKPPSSTAQAAEAMQQQAKTPTPLANTGYSLGVSGNIAKFMRKVSRGELSVEDARAAFKQTLDELPSGGLLAAAGGIAERNKLSMTEGEPVKNFLMNQFDTELTAELHRVTTRQEYAAMSPGTRPPLTEKVVKEKMESLIGNVKKNPDPGKGELSSSGAQWLFAKWLDGYRAEQLGWVTKSSYNPLQRRNPKDPKDILVGRFNHRLSEKLLSENKPAPAGQTDTYAGAKNFPRR